MRRNSSLVLSPSTIVGDGVAASSATVTARDANSNLVSGAVVSFPAVPNVSGTGGQCTTSAVAGPGFGTCSLSLTSTVSGSYAIHATIGGVDVGGSPATLTVTAGAPSAGASTWTVAPAGPVTANGVAAYTVTFTAKDANGNTVTTPGTVFAVPAVPNLTASAPSCTTGGTGTCTIYVYVDGRWVVCDYGDVGCGWSGVDESGEPHFGVRCWAPVAGNSSSGVWRRRRLLVTGWSASMATVTARDANSNLGFGCRGVVPGGGGCECVSCVVYDECRRWSEFWDV